MITKQIIHNLPIKPDDIRKRIGLGDIVSVVAIPIAKKLKLSCFDNQTNKLKPDSACNKRKEKLNAIFK